MFPLVLVPGNHDVRVDVLTTRYSVLKSDYLHVSYTPPPPTIRNVFPTHIDTVPETSTSIILLGGCNIISPCLYDSNTPLITFIDENRELCVSRVLRHGNIPSEYSLGVAIHHYMTNHIGKDAPILVPRGDMNNGLRNYTRRGQKYDELQDTMTYLFVHQKIEIDAIIIAAGDISESKDDESIGDIVRDTREYTPWYTSDTRIFLIESATNNMYNKIIHELAQAYDDTYCIPIDNASHLPGTNHLTKRVIDDIAYRIFRTWGTTEN